MSERNHRKRVGDLLEVVVLCGEVRRRALGTKCYWYSWFRMRACNACLFLNLNICLNLMKNICI